MLLHLPALTVTLSFSFSAHNVCSRELGALRLGGSSFFSPIEFGSGKDPVASARSPASSSERNRKLLPPCACASAMFSCCYVLSCALVLGVSRLSLSSSSILFVIVYFSAACVLRSCASQLDRVLCSLSCTVSICDIRYCSVTVPRHVVCMQY